MYKLILFKNLTRGTFRGEAAHCQKIKAFKPDIDFADIHINKPNAFESHL